jgi:hypothetical protein
MLFFWAIGVLFTAGYALDRKRESAWQQVKMAVLIFVLWPFVLGYAISENKKSKS